MSAAVINCVHWERTLRGNVVLYTEKSNNT